MAGIHFQNRFPPGEDEVSVRGGGASVVWDLPGQGSEQPHGLCREREVVEKGIRQRGQVRFGVNGEYYPVLQAVRSDLDQTFGSTVQALP